MDLAKSAALIRLGEDRTALMLTLGPSQPDSMLPPGIAVASSATVPNALEVSMGTAMIREAVEAAGMGVEPIPTSEGARPEP